jgi:uncharacterized protein
VSRGERGSDPFANDVTFVLILSTLCNLRCRYCYQLPDLANPARMSQEQLALIFSRVAAHYQEAPSMSIRFAWQGGEALLIEPDYFRAAMAAQRRAFTGSPHRVVNVLQTNLTVLDDERVAMLVECFDGVGVSHDVVGDLRVDAGGRTRHATVVRHLDRLIAEGIPLGGITVLTRQNVDHIAEIYAFWRERSLPFRLVPVHRGPAPMPDGTALTPEEVRQAFCECADLWMADEQSTTSVAPLSELVDGIIHRHMPGAGVLPYDKDRREVVFIVHSNGSTNGINDLIDSDVNYGNIFDADLATLLAGAGHRRAARRARALMQATCTECPFHGNACSGHPVGEGDKELVERDADDAVICTITRGTLAHIERRLVRLNVIDVVTGELRLQTP